ncbi:polysaccharide deacetylase family protein [Negadavirga shengliensis]|uniref:Polysaccharide deacetylase family protein n=1 Tax=Negadavirga shengliensis TaxID=1389218 RepID=A0ABV9T4A9_9BACT
METSLGDKNNGILTISLDFELLWGLFDKIGGRVDRDYFRRTRTLIPGLLELFQAYGVEVTWATVGMLFADNEEEWRAFQPEILPTYRDEKLSAYHWAGKFGLDPDLHFAPDLIRQVMDCPGQEIGSHTFAHYYTLSPGQSPEQFRADLQASQHIAKSKFGISLASLVFPRNHINFQYLDICLEEGFSQVRGNPADWYWQENQHEGWAKKIFRTADCLVPLGKDKTYGGSQVYQYREGLWVLPASRFLRPIKSRSPISNSLKAHRIKSEMSEAAQKGRIYHLWWHPHNFALTPEDSFRELETLLRHYKKLQEEYGMASLSMKNLGLRLGG